MLPLLFASLVLAETLQATQPVACTRWPGEKGISLALQAGDEVEVLAQDGTHVRVRKGTEFGWAEEAALSPVAGTPSDVASSVANSKPSPKAKDDTSKPRKKGKRRPANAGGAQGM